MDGGEIAILVIEAMKALDPPSQPGPRDPAADFNDLLLAIGIAAMSIIAYGVFRYLNRTRPPPS